jgi:hypothetical protein
MCIHVFYIGIKPANKYCSITQDRLKDRFLMEEMYFDFRC